MSILNLLIKTKIDNCNINLNPSINKLTAETINSGFGQLGPHGEVLVKTGSHTGRAADDKYVVESQATDKKVWWENNIKKMPTDVFLALKEEVLHFLQNQKELYASTRSVGHPDFYSINIDLISTHPSSIYFSYFLFKEARPENAKDPFTILQAPELKLNPEKYGLRSNTAIVIDFSTKTVLIVGTAYHGEIKKSAFSIMNFILPDMGILPMHSGACTNKTGSSFIFFGLSGTGKTTLSTDTGTQLIGDDEHGLSASGIFNFENGCYAKTYKLSEDSEPDIYKASTQATSFLENVKFDKLNNTLDFMSSEITENGRASYPLTFINNRILSGSGPIPKDIFFLSADAFGVLPAISKLNIAQVRKFFILGYTAKLAGTEIGVLHPKATFSSCFGAPFMLQYPKVYADLLAAFVEKNNIRVWLLNTGWFGGAYGEGQRFPLKITRQIIRSIQSGALDSVRFSGKQTLFGLEIPEAITGVESEYLDPMQTWQDPQKYLLEANRLNDLFKSQAQDL